MTELILFDVGGVLIELVGVPVLLEWTKGRMDEEELWRRWLTSPTVRRYETGQSTSNEFARGIVDELDLPVTREEFLHEFATWPKGPYPGASDLLNTLSARHTLATLCNTNEIYWRKFQQSGLLDHFQHHFASHQIGVLKPDEAAFRHVCDFTGVCPENVLFLDDNQLNVDGAKAAGLQAYRTKGTAAARSQLEALGFLERTAEPKDALDSK